MHLTTVLLLGITTVATISSTGAAEFGVGRLSGQSGGGRSVMGPYEITATIGQPVSGSSSAGVYTIIHGFRGAAADSTPGPELIVNGSFENISETFVPDAAGVMSLPVGSATIPGWTTTDAELVWVSNVNTFGAETPFGGHSIELTGYHDRVPYAGVRQTIPTTPDQSYRLSVALGSNSEYPGAGGQKQVTVRCGAAETLFVFDPTGTPANEWRTFGFHFVADAPSTEVTITGLNASGIYLGLDNVSVVASTAPELKISGTERVGNNLHFRFPTVAGRSYVIESRTDLGIGGWMPISGPATTGTGQLVNATLVNSISGPQRFYRVRTME
jgi:hypothetical protein